MALNLSHRSIFPTWFSEEGLRSSIKVADGCVVEGYRDKNFDVLGNNIWDFNWDLKNSCDYGEEAEKGRYDNDNSISDNIMGLLPEDPFGMNVSSTFTTLTGWFGNCEKCRELDFDGFVADEIEVKRSNRKLFAGLNLVWDQAMMLLPEVDTKEIVTDKSGDASCHGGVVSAFTVGESLEDGPRGNCVVSYPTEELHVCSKIFDDRANEERICSKIYIDDDDDVGAPHNALFFVLGYLDVQGLLSVERVCRSLRDAVKKDPLLWRSIHIGRPLSERITDGALFQLTNRAQGTLGCLSLEDCFKITDTGLKLVLESNPSMTKLSVPGCVKLSVEGILYNLKAFKFAGASGIKYLRIGGIYGVTNTHFEELKFLLGADDNMQLKTHKPRFYRGGQLYVSCDDDCPIDIETCPRCQMLRLVYDCPAESCQGENHGQLCRACTLCIARCIHCGRCINDCDYEETFCLDILCLDCWRQLLIHQERVEENCAPSSKHTLFHKETTYRLCFMARRD